MGIYEFNILSENEKYDIVFTKGQFVDTLTNANIKYVLYSVSMFWVEVVYNAKTNKIIDLSSFIEGITLNKYSNVPKKL